MKLKLGVIGLSEGNGHPYSWSSVFNGFDALKPCPFEVIPDYLGKASFPQDFLCELAEVTHIWTQDTKISEQVAAFSKIPNISERMEDMIGEVDAVLLARDDAENHLEMAQNFIKNEIPIFIDKPLAFSIEEANKILACKKNDEQLIYSCSALRFAKEFDFQFGKTEYTHADAYIPNDWKKYAVHIIEPVVKMFPQRGELLSVKRRKPDDNVSIVDVEWEHFKATFNVMGSHKVPLKIVLNSEKGQKELNFKDTFHCFRGSLEYFVNLIHGKCQNIPESETLEIISIIEKGRL